MIKWKIEMEILEFLQKMYPLTPLEVAISTDSCAACEQML